MELIKEAGLNTLLGMGMTFLVLISLSLIISLFGKILNGGFEKKRVEVVGEKKAPSPPAKSSQASLEPADAPKEEVVSAETPPEGADDPAVMAVIAAAVAAYESNDEIVAAIAAAIAAAESEGETRRILIPGASGFAVRKIRKSRSHVA